MEIFQHLEKQNRNKVFVSKETLMICISFSICFSIWMVAKGFPWPSKIVRWWWKTFGDHKSQSLTGHWNFFATIQPYIVDIYLIFGWWWTVFRDHSVCELMLIRITSVSGSTNIHAPNFQYCILIYIHHFVVYSDGQYGQANVFWNRNGNQGDRWLRAQTTTFLNPGPGENIQVEASTTFHIYFMTINTNSFDNCGLSNW